MNFNDRFAQIRKRKAELRVEIDLESKKEAEALRECRGTGRTERFITLVHESNELDRQELRLIKEAELAVRRAVSGLGIDQLITVNISGVGCSLAEIDVWKLYDGRR